MARRLLKRKLKITNLKKLKTTQRTFTSLGQWALKQLSKKQKPLLSTPYPKHLSLSLPLHRKQLLSQLVGSFSCLTATNPLQVAKQTYLSKGVTNQRFVKPLFGNDNWDKPPTPHKKAQSLMPSEKVELSGRRFAPNIDLGSTLSSGPGAWPTYRLNCKTLFTKARICTSKWKSIYSLDQLMCHQYDSQRQFTRHSSKLKLSLMENQKLTALYGKVPKRQLIRMLQKANSNRPHHMALLLESRLDVAIKRCFVFNTLRNAQHWISQGRILVNHKTITSPSYILKPGDLLAIGKSSKERYKNQFLNYFYKLPKESKFIQSGKLLSRWKEWASLYNYLGSHHVKLTHKKLMPYFNPEAAERKKVILPTPLTQPSCVRSSSLAKGSRWETYLPANHKVKLLPQSVAKPLLTFPDKAVEAFWYSSGRHPLKCLYEGNKSEICLKSLICNELALQRRPGAENLLKWLSGQRWLRSRLKWLRFRHWKDVYRRRILIFSRWLLSAGPAKALTLDGLYSLRWHRGFIRKKSTWIKGSHRHLTLQKALQFEVSYKKLCAVYLYSPQRIALPFMIDFRKV